MQEGIIVTTQKELQNLISETLDNKIKELKLELQSKPTDLLPRKEVAKILNVSEGTLYNWAKKGYLTPVSIGRRVYYNRSDINEALIKLSYKN